MVPNLQIEFVHGVFPATLQKTSYIFLYCLMYSYVTNDKTSMMTRIEAWLSFAFNPLSFTLYTTSGLLAIIWHAFPWDGTRYVMSEVGWHFMSLLLAPWSLWVSEYLRIWYHLAPHLNIACNLRRGSDSYAASMGNCSCGPALSCFWTLEPCNWSNSKSSKKYCGED